MPTPPQKKRKKKTLFSPWSEDLNTLFSNFLIDDFNNLLITSNWFSKDVEKILKHN